MDTVRLRQKQSVSPAWRRSPYLPPDFNGPADVPFDPPPANFTEAPIFALFEAAAVRDPSACALVSGLAQISYGALRRHALALAQRIDALAPPDAPVAILLEHSADAVVGLLACLAARRIALVLNAGHPLERNAAILRDAAAAAVVVAAGGPCPAGSPAAVPIAPITADPPEPCATWQPPAPAPPDAPAIVLYTSGSAGRPKGIVLSQFGMLYRVQRNIAGAHLNRADRMLPLSALSSVNGCSYILAILLAGGTLVQPSLTSPRNLRAVIQSERITALIGLPRLLDMLVTSDAHEPLTSLRMVRPTGEGMRQSELAALRAALPRHCHINITYGMTEASVTHWWVPHGFTGSDALLPVGYPCDGIDFVIIGTGGEPIADGAVGEIVVRSRVVALGEFIGGRCVPGRISPCPTDPTRRVFATGDLVRMRPDGMLQFVARGDRQIKVNGQRVEPAEIEETMRRFPGVAEAIIITEGTDDSHVLLGFVVPTPGTDPQQLHRALRDALRQHLPGIMRPSRLIMLDRLPRLPSGKVDRQTLIAGMPRGASMLRTPMVAAITRYVKLAGRSFFSR